MLQVNLHVLHDWCCPLKCSKYTHNGKEPYYCMYNFLANNHCHDWTVLKPFRLCLKRKYTIILITHNTLTSKRNLRTLSIREISVLPPLWTDHSFALDDFCLESKVPGVVLESHDNTRTGTNNTHLLRTIFANSDVACILRAKTIQLYLTGKGWRSDPRRIEKNVFQGHC